MMRLAIVFCLIAAIASHAVGTVAQSVDTVNNVRRIVFTCTADAAAATYPTTEISTKIEGKLLKIVTNPGSTAPTDNYDVYLYNQHGIDVLGGMGANRDTANTEEQDLLDQVAESQLIVSKPDTLSLVVSGNSVNSAVTVITLYFALVY